MLNFISVILYIDEIYSNLAFWNTITVTVACSVKNRSVIENIANHKFTASCFGN